MEELIRLICILVKLTNICAQKGSGRSMKYTCRETSKRNPDGNKTGGIE